MYNNLRTHTINKKLGFAAVAVVLFVTVLAILAAGVLAPSAYASVSVRDGTYLVSSSGLSLGNNVLRTTGGSAATLIYSSADANDANSLGSDFWFDYGTAGSFATGEASDTPNTVGFSPESMSIRYYTMPTSMVANATNFYFNSKILLKSDSGLYQNLQQAQSNLTFSVAAKFKALDGADAYADTFALGCYFSANGVDSNFSSEIDKTAAGEWDTVTTSITIRATEIAELALNPSAFFQLYLGKFRTEGADTATGAGGIEKPTTGIMVEFKDISVTVSVASALTMSFGSLGVRAASSSASAGFEPRPDGSVIYTPSVLAEGTTVYADGTYYTPESTNPYSLYNGTVYVKKGDFLYLYSDVLFEDSLGNSSQMYISPDYTTSMKSSGTAVSWTYTNVDSEEFNYYEAFQTIAPTETSSADEISGRTSIWRYNGTRYDGVSLTVNPRFITSFRQDSLTGQYIYTYLPANSLTIRFDNTAPLTPVLSTTDNGIGQYSFDTEAEAYATPYTKSNTVRFRLSSDSIPNGETSFAPETLYYTLDGSNPLGAGRQAVALSSSGEGSITFPSVGNTEPYHLQMVVVDKAGNVSDVVQKYIAVDTTKYGVSAVYYNGTSDIAALRPAITPGTASGNQIAAASFLTPSGTYKTASDYSYTRTDTFSLQIKMSATQYNKFRLVEVRNNATGDARIILNDSQINFTRESDGYYYFSVSYIMSRYTGEDPGGGSRTFDFLSTTASRQFVFLFKQRAEVTVSNKTPYFSFTPATAGAAAYANVQGVTVTVNSAALAEMVPTSTYYSLTPAGRTAYGTLSALQSAYSTPQSAVAAGYVQEVAPKFAGEYWYWVSIPEGSSSGAGYDKDYFIDEGGLFTIQKADPLVSGVMFTDGSLDVNGDAIIKDLVYGTGGLGTFINSSIMGKNDGNQYSTTVSSIGVLGLYVIKDPVSGDINYRNPSVGLYNVSVTFVPSSVNSYNGGLNSILNADNFAESPSIVLTLRVVPYEVSLKVDDALLTTVYNKREQPLVALVSFDGGLTYITEAEAKQSYDSNFELVYTYKAFGAANFLTTIPSIAGEYDAKITVNQDYSPNYKGTYVLSEQLVAGQSDVVKRYTVEKELLQVRDNLDASYYYSYYSRPMPSAYRYISVNGVEREETESVGISYVFTYKTLAEADYDSTVPQNAGHYYTRIEINAINYEGYVEREFDILKVNLGSANLTKNFPTATQINASSGAHASYGQTLGDVTWVSGSQYGLNYLYNGSTLARKVEGDFRFAASPDEYDALGLSSVLAADRSHINTPLDFVSNSTTPTYTFTLLYVPADSVNFEPVADYITIKIDKATPDYSQKMLSPLTYGQRYGESVLSGDMFLNKAVYAGGVASTVRETVSGNYVTNNASANQIFNVTTGDGMDIRLTFTPTGTSALYYNPITFTTKLVVNKQPASVIVADVVDLVYGTATDLAGLATVGIAGESLLYRYYYTSAVDTTEDITPSIIGDAFDLELTTPVGLYIAELYIGESSNYAANRYVYLSVGKATPNIIQAGQLSDFEIGDDIYAYGKGFAALATVTHPNDVFNERVLGTFSLQPGQTAIQTMSGVFRYLFNFTPTGDSAANYAAVNGVELAIAVNKRTVSLAATEAELTKTYTGATVRPAVTATYDGGAVEVVGFSYSVDTVDAGVYRLTVSVSADDATYRGVKTFENYTILPNTQVNLSILGSLKPWTGTAVIPEYVLSAASGDPSVGAVVEYFDYQGNALAELTEVGQYNVSITLGGNYSGVKTFGFSVTQAQVSYVGAAEGVIRRTYNSESTATGRVVIETLSPDVLLRHTTVKYAEVVAGVTGSFSEISPYEAGTYVAKTFFNYNGYQGSDAGVMLVIEKATITELLRPVGTPEFVYSASAPMFSPAAGIIVEGYAFRYRANEADEWQTTQFVDVGSYFVEISVVDPNYRGVFVYPYIISAAELTLGGLVSMANVPYGDFDTLTDSEIQALFDYTDAFRFNNAFITDGTFRVLTTGISSLYAGTYTINYIFTPTNTSIAPLNGEVSLTVSKKDVSEYLEFVSEDLIVGYDGTAYGVGVRFVNPNPFSASVQRSILSAASVYYGGTAARPSAVGSYALTAFLQHLNYTVNLSGATLTIEKGSPEIVAPESLGRFSGTVNISATAVLSDGITTVDLNALNTVYARVSSSGYPVSGTFSAVAQTISGANVKSFDVIFTPDESDSGNFVSANATLYFTLAGTSVSISSVSLLGSIPEYGAPLSSYALSAATLNVVVSGGFDWETYGGFQWVYPDTVPDVGTSPAVLKYVAGADYRDVYGDKSFDVSITVSAKKTVVLSEAVYADVIGGSTYAAATFVLPQAWGYLAEAGTFTVTSPFMNDIVPLSLEGLESQISYSYSSSNYTLADGSAALKLRMNASSFKVGNTSLNWSGSPLVKSGLAEALDIRVSGTNVASEFIFTIFDASGTEVDSIASIGSYTIIAEIDRAGSNNAGSATISFEMKKMDLSPYISLNGGVSELSTVYLTGLQLFPSMTVDGVEDAIEYMYYYKKSGEADAAFSIYNKPQFAGKYVLRLAVEGSDFYTGHKDYVYTVEKKTVSIKIDAVTRTYGNATAPVPIIGDGVTSYIISYYSVKDRVTLYTLPENAGSYLATVTVTDDNYRGSKAFDFTILSAATAIITAPTLSNIVYGQLLSAATLTNMPEASTPGSFEFADGSIRLSAGTQMVDMVFVPANENFATVTMSVEITVARAAAGIDYRVLEKQYTGSRLAPTYTVSPDATLATSVILTYYRLTDGGSYVETAPVGQGTYYVKAVLDVQNYYYNIDGSEEYKVFVIKKASALVDLYVAPTASSIVYGQALNGNSTLSGGVVKYYNGIPGGISVSGEFTFRHGDSALGNAGVYDSVELVFTPSASYIANYSEFRCTTSVEVIKATAAITLDAGTNKVVYGEAITAPTFTVAPVSTLALVFDSNYNNNLLGNVLPAGSYSVSVEIDPAEVNYQGSLLFYYYVERAPATIKFFDKAEEVDRVEVSYYNYEFRNLASNYFAYVTDGAVNGDSYAEIRDDLVPTFSSFDGTVGYDSLAAMLRAVGEYKITLSFNSQSNYIGTSSIAFSVTKISIDRIVLPVATLQQQVYGTVVVPEVQFWKNGVVLRDVEYHINYGDSGTDMPNRAGTYAVMVNVTDPDYQSYRKQANFVINRKSVSVINITVEDKLFDGVPSVASAGTLSGVLLGDEVTLELAARTKGGKIDPGEYGIEFVTAKLYGLDSGNYVLTPPVFNGTMVIYSNRIMNEDKTSYIVFGESVSSSAKFAAGEVQSPLNKEGLISSLLGQKAAVVNFSIRDNGIKMELSNPVKVYIKIPERFLKESNLKVEGLGELADAGITFTREGDYITFYTTVSGEVVFAVSNFPYGILFVGIAMVVLLFGFVAIRLLDPAKLKLGVSGLRRYDAIRAETDKFKQEKRKAESKPPKGG